MGHCRPDDVRAGWTAVAASGGAFGVLAGGVLTETLDWPAIFLVNLPVGLAVFAGVLLATGSLVALIYGLVEAPDSCWGSAQTIALIGAAATGIAAFAAVEARMRESRSSHCGSSDAARPSRHWS